MKAIIHDTYGAPEVLQVAEVEKPVPGDLEILVRVRAAAVAVADVRARAFDVPRVFWLPARLSLGLFRPKHRVLGAELAGEVAAVGAGVTRFQPGDRVMAVTLPGFGGYAEFVCLPEDGIVAHAPHNLNFEEAAALPIGARTALHYLQKAGFGPGQKILVYGASGSVGTYAVQLAKHFGAEVTAVCSTRNLELVRSLGADAVIDYTREDFTRTNQRYDVVFEAVSKSEFVDCQQVLKPGGTYINVTDPLPTSLAMLRAMMSSGYRIMLGENPPENAEGLEAIKTLVEAGAIRPVMDRCYPVAEIVAAHRYVDTGRKRGNVVVRMVA